MSGAPILFYFQRWKALFFGSVFLVFGTVLAAAVIKAILLGDMSLLWGVALLILSASFAPKALEYLTICARNPVALQMDAQGISGYKFAPIPWEQIRAVSALRGRKRHRYLGINVTQPNQFRTNLSGLAYLRSALWQWRYGQDIVLEGFLLKTDEAEVIAKAAHPFLMSQTS